MTDKQDRAALVKQYLNEAAKLLREEAPSVARDGISTIQLQTIVVALMLQLASNASKR